MSDVSTLETTADPRTGPHDRRRTVRLVVTVAGVVVLMELILLVAWYVLSSPVIEPGAAGPLVGVSEASVHAGAAPPVVWQVTRNDAWLAWTVRNDGWRPVTLSSGLPAATGTSDTVRADLPFLQSRYANRLTHASTGAPPSELVDRLALAPGEQGLVVLHVAVPAGCLTTAPAGTPLPYAAAIVWVPVDATVLHRTTSMLMDLPGGVLDLPVSDRCVVEQALSGLAPGA